jgi:hypothetical protein
MRKLSADFNIANYKQGFGREVFRQLYHYYYKKMHDHFGIIGTELEWFKSYLTNREQQCTVNGQISSPKKTVCGIPQGSTWGRCCFYYI